MGRVLLASLTVLLAGCESALAPVAEALPEWGDFQLPPPDDSLDPNQLVVGEILATACSFGMYGDGLEPLRARHEWVVVDVFFGRNTPEGPWRGPTEYDKGWITSHGGRVLHDFSVPAVRTRIIMSAIPGMVSALLAEGQWPVIRAVPDLTRYDVPSLTVGFSVQLTDEHVAFYESLGGRVEHRFDFISALSGVLPDRSIPILRDRIDATYIQASGVFCLA